MQSIISSALGKGTSSSNDLSLNKKSSSNSEQTSPFKFRDALDKASEDIDNQVVQSKPEGEFIEQRGIIPNDENLETPEQNKFVIEKNLEDEVLEDDKNVFASTASFTTPVTQTEVINDIRNARLFDDQLQEQILAEVVKEQANGEKIVESELVNIDDIPARPEQNTYIRELENPIQGFDTQGKSPTYQEVKDIIDGDDIQSVKNNAIDLRFLEDTADAIAKQQSKTSEQVIDENPTDFNKLNSKVSVEELKAIQAYQNLGKEAEKKVEDFVKGKLEFNPALDQIDEQPGDYTKFSLTAASTKKAGEKSIDSNAAARASDHFKNLSNLDDQSFVPGDSTSQQTQSQFEIALGKNLQDSKNSNDSSEKEYLDNIKLTDSVDSKFGDQSSLSNSRISSSIDSIGKNFSEQMQKFSDTEINSDEVLGKFKMMLNSNKDEMTVKLSPEFLGKLEVKLLRDAEGVLQARMQVESDQAKSLLEGKLFPEMKKSLEEQGIKFQDFQVNVKEDLGNGTSFAFSDREGMNDRSAFQGARKVSSRTTLDAALNGIDEVAGNHTKNYSEKGLSLYA